MMSALADIIIAGLTSNACTPERGTSTRERAQANQARTDSARFERSLFLGRDRIDGHGHISSSARITVQPGGRAGLLLQSYPARRAGGDSAGELFSQPGSASSSVAR
jgi:hypothetical protein